MGIKTILREALGRAVALIFSPIIALAVGVILFVIWLSELSEKNQY